MSEFLKIPDHWLFDRFYSFNLISFIWFLSVVFVSLLAEGMKPSSYHKMVAQNFLSNISLDGSHNDTSLRIFSPEYNTKKCADAVKFQSGPIQLTGTNDLDESIGNLTIPMEELAEVVIVESVKNKQGDSVQPRRKSKVAKRRSIR